MRVLLTGGAGYIGSHAANALAAVGFELNVGMAQAIRSEEVIDTVAEISGRSICARSMARRLGDPAELVANPAKAAAVLHWKASRSDLRTIVNSALWWHTRL